MDLEVMACSLDERAFAERAAAWREIASLATSRSIEQGRVVSTYPADVELLDRVRALIAAEAGCCSFLRFDVRERADELVVELRYPEEARALVDGLSSGPRTTSAALREP